MNISLALQSLASIMSLVAVWRMTDQKLDGPIIGLVAQVFWYAMIWHDGSYGLLIVTIGFTIIYARAVWKWLPANLRG